jgi:hypothetical protein
MKRSPYMAVTDVTLVLGFQPKKKSGDNRKLKKREMNILQGSRIVGESGQVLVVDRVEGEIIFSGNRRIKTSAVVRVEPPLEISHLRVGDVLKRVSHHFNGKYIHFIQAATVERVSHAGVWVRTNSPEASIYHVSDMAIEEGWWQRVDESDGTEP